MISSAILRLQILLTEAYKRKKTGRFGLLGVSVAGGVMHNVGQLIVAAFMVETAALLYYLPVLLISGCIAGIVIGIAGAEAVKRLPGSVL